MTKIITPKPNCYWLKYHFSASSLFKSKIKSAKMGGVLIAIYSLNIKIQSRGKGKSAIAAAAYIAGERFKNEYDGTIHDRTERNDVVHKEIVLPENAPTEFYDRATLWNAVELSERAKNAQLCRSLRIALPKDFTLEQNINLTHQYVNENFVSRGMCADVINYKRTKKIVQFRHLRHRWTWTL